MLFLFLGYSNALITFENVDELAVLTTSCFKTINRHGGFQTPHLNMQAELLSGSIEDNAETVGAIMYF